MFALHEDWEKNTASNEPLVGFVVSELALVGPPLGSGGQLVVPLEGPHVGRLGEALLLAR